jgi:hypothetical protein
MHFGNKQRVARSLFAAASLAARIVKHLCGTGSSTRSRARETPTATTSRTG